MTLKTNRPIKNKNNLHVNKQKQYLSSYYNDDTCKKHPMI